MVFSYAEDEEWQDLWSIVKSRGSRDSKLSKVCRIMYTPEYEEALEFFHVVCERKEYSERALELTEHIINLCPAHYTVWHYRQQILTNMMSEASLLKELEFLNDFTPDNKKNYQIWNHRQFVVTKLNKAEGELEFVKTILELDSKNYHAWSYRQWVIKHFDLWDNELSYIDGLLEQDVYNNSAWNQRYFVVKSQGYSVDKELEYTFEKIQRTPNNESPWLYLRGLVNDCENDPRIIDFCNNLYQKSEAKSSHLLLLMHDIHMAKAERQEAIEKLEMLIKIDPLRRNYWQSLLKECK